MGDTATMWGDMLGIGPILKTVADPAFHAQLAGFLQAMQATHILALQAAERADRCERKLDLLLHHMGLSHVDLGSVDNGPAISAGNGTADRPRIAGAASVIADDGGERRTPANRVA